MLCTTIDIWRPTDRRSSLVCDLVATASAQLNVFGCEYDGGKLTHILSRGGLDRASAAASRVLSRRAGSPPRGEFDLWDLGAEIVVREYRMRTSLSLPRNPYDEKGCVIVPIEAATIDLAIAHTIASSCLPTSPRWAFVILSADGQEDDLAATLAPIGPVAPVVFHFRDVDPTEGIIGLPEGAVAEGEALWSWLRTMVDLPSASQWEA